MSSATGRGSREPSGRPAPRSARRRARRRPAAILGASRAVATLPVPLAWRCANVREREGSGKSGVGDGEGGAGAGGGVGGAARGKAWACREGVRARGALISRHVVAPSSVPPSCAHGCFGSLEGWHRDSPRQRGRSVSSPACVAMWALAGAQVAVGAGGRGGEFGGRLRATGRLKGRPAVVCAPSLLVPSRASPQRPPRSAPTSPSANVRTALLLNLLENSWLVLAAVVGAAQRWDLHLGEGRGVRRPRRHGVDCRARARVLHGPSTRWHRFANC